MKEFTEQPVVYNRSHNFDNGGPSTVTFSVKSRRLSISSAACGMLSLKKGDFLHPLQIGSSWFLFKDNSDKNGYLVSTHSTHNLTANCTDFVRSFINMKKLDVSKNHSFYVQIGNSEYKGFKLLEIITNKTVEEILKNNR